MRREVSYNAFERLELITDLCNGTAGVVPRYHTAFLNETVEKYVRDFEN